MRCTGTPGPSGPTGRPGKAVLRKLPLDGNAWQNDNLFCPPSRNSPSAFVKSVRFCLLIAAALLAGCSGVKPCSVSGQITFKGEPIPDGSVKFEPAGESESASGSAKIVNGSYSIGSDQGMLAGKFKVSIYAQKATGKTVKGFDGAAPVPEVVQYIPARYNDQSELIVELNGGDNTKDFPLEP